jgi:hypothetical protein
VRLCGAGTLRSGGSLIIDVMVKETNEKVGELEYYCAEPIKKTVNLIYVKFKGETNYPNPYTNDELQKFLNENSHNQFFIEYLIQSENFEIDQDRITFLSRKNSTEAIYYGLKVKKFPTYEWDKEVAEYNKKFDYYFVTDIEKVKTTADDGSPGSYLGGAHWLGTNGGAHLKTTSPIGETQVELDAHEFGHWIGIPHPFEEKDRNGNIVHKSKPFIKIETNQGSTKDNFMDYNVRRKTWFKLQLLNTNRDSN